MDALVTLLRECWRFLWPIYAIRVYQRGIRFRHWPEKDSPLAEELAPGLHFCMWIIEDIEVIGIKPDTIDLPEQSYTTQDNLSITISANIAYEIHDARACYTEVQDYETSLARIAMNHLTRKIRKWTWAELLEKQNDLETSLRETLTTRIERYGWGITILEVGLTDLVVAGQHRHFGVNFNVDVNAK